MNWKKEELIQAFNGPLPGLSAHNMVMSYARPAVDEVLQSEKNPRFSAVVFLLYPKPNGWYFLLLKRHDYEGVHSGQVGLPGGSIDQGESPEEAALRELHEESGLKIDHSRIIAPLTALYIPPSNFIVSPYAAIFESEPNWRFDSREVKRGLEIPLVELLKKESLIRTTVLLGRGSTQLDVKAFSFENETVWGATAMILSECKEILRTLAA